MAAVNVILVRRIDDGLAVRACRDKFDFEVSGREKLRSSAICGNGIEMNPSTALPRKHDAIAGCPDQLILSDNFVKDAAAAGVGVPNFLAFARCGVSNVNGPRLAFAVCAKGKPALCDGNAKKCHSAAVWRPGRFPVGVHTRLKIDQGFGRKVVNADEAVVSA